MTPEQALKRIEEQHAACCAFPDVLPCDVVKLARALDALAADYEVLLMTLAPSRSNWVQHIYRNAMADYQKLNPHGVLSEVAAGAAAAGGGNAQDG